jgi:hypothetical protein
MLSSERQIMRIPAVLPTFCAILVAGSVCAQTNPPADVKRFTGTVDSVSGNDVKVKSSEASIVAMRLTPATRIMVRKPASMADIGANTFLGCTAVAQASGELQATECHIFPESMRGAGEGHNPMGPPATTMTNGNVTTMTNGSVQAADGKANTRLLKITYKDGTQNILVTPKTEMTSIVPVDAKTLKPGVKIAGAAHAGADGSVELVFVNVMP